MTKIPVTIKKEDVTTALLQQAAQELDVTSPIRAYEVRDGRLILHLAYNQQVSWPPDTGDSSPIPSGDLSNYTKSELYEWATWADVQGRSTMTKVQLINALEDLR